jgi:hypothetical protein
MVAWKQSKEKKSLMSNSTVAFESSPKRKGLEHNDATSKAAMKYLRNITKLVNWLLTPSNKQLSFPIPLRCHLALDYKVSH